MYDVYNMTQLEYGDLRDYVVQRKLVFKWFPPRGRDGLSDSRRLRATSRDSLVGAVVEVCVAI